METGQINFPLYIQWNFTTVRPYPPAIKTQATRRLGKGGLFHLEGEVGKKRINIWSKSTRSDIISSAAVALFLPHRRQQGVRAFRGSSGCCVAYQPMIVGWERELRGTPCLSPTLYTCPTPLGWPGIAIPRQTFFDWSFQESQHIRDPFTLYLAWG